MTGSISSLTSTPKQSKFPEQEKVEPVQNIEEDADTARRNRRKLLLSGGRRSTILAGIQNALKKRLGE